VSADDVCGALLHSYEIEGPGAVPDEGRERRWADRLGGDAVLVGLAARTVAGVEVCGSLFYRDDADAGGEDVIEGSLEVGGGDGRAERDGGYLADGVHTGVCATGALGENGFYGDVMEGLGEGALDGGEGGLNLPAVIRRAVVGDCELPVRHGDKWTVPCEGFCDHGGEDEVRVLIPGARRNGVTNGG